MTLKRRDVVIKNIDGANNTKLTPDNTKIVYDEEVTIHSADLPAPKPLARLAKWADQIALYLGEDVAEIRSLLEKEDDLDVTLSYEYAKALYTSLYTAYTNSVYAEVLAPYVKPEQSPIFMNNMYAEVLCPYTKPSAATILMNSMYAEVLCPVTVTPDISRVHSLQIYVLAEYTG